MKASVHLDHTLLAIEGEHSVHVLLELEAPASAPAKERAPLRLAVVVDRSGSMSGPKLDVTKACVEYLVRRLDPTDHVALVTYDDQVDLLSPLQPVDQGALAALVAGIHPGGSTNLSGGWLKGAEELRRPPMDGIRTVLLLTDGLANVGITDRHALEVMAKATRSDGVGTSTIGFGADFDEELLTGMAEAGEGNSYYAATPDEAPAIFAAELEGLLSLAAQNVSVEIRPGDAVELVGILNEYPAVVVPGGVQVQVGDAYAGETRRVVFEMRIPNLGALGPASVADIVLRYVSVGDEIAAHEVTVPVVVNVVSADEAAGVEADGAVTEQVVILKAAKARREAVERADRGDYDGARAVLEDVAGTLRRLAPGSAQAEELMTHADELTESAQMMAPSSYTAGDRKALHFQAHQTQRGRRQPPNRRQP